MSRPLLLDLFCGAGGAAMGYHLAGFDVVGVDIKPQPRYPFRFVQGDALDVLAGWDLVEPRPAAIHASPPCQGYSVTRFFTARTDYVDLLPPTRTALQKIGLPWVIENVPGAPMRPDFKLCGCMFGLRRLKRERWFETSWRGFDLRQPCHHPEPVISVAGHDVPSHYRKFHGTVPIEDRRAAMGIDWMNRDELGEAIPPAYTRFIGEQLIEQLSLARAS